MLQWGKTFAVKRKNTVFLTDEIYFLKIKTVQLVIGFKKYIDIMDVR